jgi:purine-binding chemotaxis protein CheW
MYPARTIYRIKGGHDIMAAVTNTMDREVNVTTDRGGKYLTFSLVAEEYGIGIRKVKEIIGMMAITVIPQTPAYVKGVINLRGKVIPVIDLRLKFGIEEMEYTDRTCIIVMEVMSNNGKILTGIVVDAVSEVLNVRAADIEDTPTFGAGMNTDYILGMAKAGAAVKILLDIDKVISAQEMAMVQRAA